MRLIESANGWTSHLLELRRRLIVVGVVLLLSLGLGLWSVEAVLSWVKAGAGHGEVNWNVFSPWDAIRLYMNIALVIAAGLTSPFLLYHIWAFAKPGLSPREQTAALSYIPLSVLLFASGVSFGYFVLFPLLLQFTSGLSAQMGLTETYGIASYFSFLIQLVLPVALLFQMPVVVLLLTRLHILKVSWLRKQRKTGYLLLTILSTLVTPPDFVSTLIVIFPLLLLYEISIAMAARLERRLQARTAVESGVVAAQRSHSSA